MISLIFIMMFLFQYSPHTKALRYTLQRRVSHESRLFSSVGRDSIPSSNIPTSVDYSGFQFSVTKTSSSSKARISLLTTPHGTVETPNFVFCATKAAMKALTTQQLREAGSQICLSNTYHLMLTPGATTVERLGGLQHMTGWRGPMMTDSGGYQIFSMGHGSVSNEIKGKRNTQAMGWNQSLISIDEQGATFRSYVDGRVHTLTPESSMDIQRALGADIILVLDECTPFNVDKAYTEASMHRSHRWAERSLGRFLQQQQQRSQALYGIVQGGIYEDLRVESVAHTNRMPYFGVAIGGSLGGDKKTMHDIVRYTRSLMRDDRPVHLLGIGGIRDIFHGVRCGIDTFDCVHPTRLGRHGGALVGRRWWERELGPATYAPPPQVDQSLLARHEKLLKREREREASFELRLRILQGVRRGADGGKDGESSQLPQVQQQLQQTQSRIQELLARLEQIRRGEKKPSKRSRGEDGDSEAKIREHVHVSSAKFRDDPRPLDTECSCYTCRTFSRGYLHHLFKAGESVGGTLVTLHNVHFMNTLMRRIREGIAADALDQVEEEYIHPSLRDSLDRTVNMGE